MKRSFVVTVEGQGWFDTDEPPNDSSYLKALIEFDAQNQQLTPVTVTVKPLEVNE